ncbi:beta-lactamase, partial [Staphylococcus aureus]
MTAGTQQALTFEFLRLCTFKAKTELEIGSWSILPFDIEQDANVPVAFIVHSTLGYKL